MIVHRFTIDLRISHRELMRYYAGQARVLHARSRCGAKLQFPVQWLRPYVVHHGICGTFVLETDANYRLLTLRCLENGII